MAFTHGYSGYTNFGCRCPICTTANTEEQQRQRVRRAYRPSTEVPHGTAGGYTNWACRCPSCTSAHAATQRARRARKRQRDNARG